MAPSSTSAPVADGARPRAERNLVLFSLDGEDYAVEAEHVREVVRAVSILPLPGAPSAVRGIVDVRGALAPVLDCRRIFGLPRRPVLPTDHFVVARAGARLVVLVVDRVIDLVPVDEDAIEEATVTPAAAHVAGVARLPTGLVLIQDLGAFLSQAEQRALDDAMDAARGGRS